MVETSWVSFNVLIPTQSDIFVLGTKDTGESLSPINALNSVDFPEFGAPTIANSASLGSSGCTTGKSLGLKSSTASMN